jgi:hypothetical protein
MTIIKQNLIHDEVRSRLYSGNACYHSLQNILSSRLLFKHINFRIYKTIILRVFCTDVKLGL